MDSAAFRAVRVRLVPANCHSSPSLSLRRKRYGNREILVNEEQFEQERDLSNFQVRLGIGHGFRPEVCLEFDLPGRSMCARLRAAPPRGRARDCGPCGCGCGVALIHGVSSVGRGMTGLGRVRFAKWRKRERESIWSGRSARCSHGAAQPLLLMILCQLRVIFLLDWMRRAPLPRRRCLCGAFVTGDVSARPGAAWCSV